MSLPKTEGEGTIEEIKEAMVQKHIPLIEEAGKKGVQIFACRKFLIHLISARGRIKHGMNLQKLFPVLQLNECRNMQRNTIW